jgi:hypothetical protein
MDTQHVKRPLDSKLEGKVPPLEAKEAPQESETGDESEKEDTE